MTARRAAAAPDPAVAAAWRAGRPGTYALALQCTRPATIRIGALGELDARPGLYVYVGSAFGSGGLRARVARHARRAKRERWHVDYLRKRLRFVGAWVTLAPDRAEHDWAARVLRARASEAPLARFGASDCGCASHLVRFPDEASSLPAVGRALGGAAAAAWLPAKWIARSTR